MRRLVGIALLLSLLLSPTTRADVMSGPKAGDKPDDFKAYGVVGILEGKEGSYLKERKDEPTVFVFVQQENWSRPMARFLKELDAKGTEANDKAAVVAVWLSEKP